MGKWAKAHTTAKKRGLTPKALKGIAQGAKDDMSPDMPSQDETPEERSLRNRQAMDLAKLDEDTNRRIKSMFAGGGGRKLFRGARSTPSSGSAMSGAGSASSGGYSGGSAGSRRTSVLP